MGCSLGSLLTSIILNRRSGFCWWLLFPPRSHLFYYKERRGHGPTSLCRGFACRQQTRTNNLNVIMYFHRPDKQMADTHGRKTFCLQLLSQIEVGGLHKRKVWYKPPSLFIEIDFLFLNINCSLFRFGGYFSSFFLSFMFIFQCSWEFVSNISYQNFLHCAKMFIDTFSRDRK